MFLHFSRHVYCLVVVSALFVYFDCCLGFAVTSCLDSVFEIGPDSTKVVLTTARLLLLLLLTATHFEIFLKDVNGGLAIQHTL